MQPILVTGAHGMLGRDCVDVLGKTHVVVPLSHAQLDISDEHSVWECLSEIRPQVIVNCAAYTDVDACETHPAAARAANVLGPKWLAEASTRLGAYLIHVSTNYVFDGQKRPPEGYTEEDAPSPRSVYGRSKWEGEKAVRSRAPEHLIVRTGWLYGSHGRSFPKAILGQTLGGKTVEVVDDQFGSPTRSLSLAHQIQVLIEARVMGTVHATSQGHCTWFQFAVEILRAMDISAEILPCATSEFPRPAPRPANSILENQRLTQLGLDRMPPWRDALERFVQSHGESLRREPRQI